MAKRKKNIADVVAGVAESITEQAETLTDEVLPVIDEAEVATDEAQPEKPKVAKWKLDRTSGVLHIECEGYDGLIQIYINNVRQKLTTRLTGKKSIQLSGLPSQGKELFIRVELLNQ